MSEIGRLMSLRKLGRDAPALTESVVVTHEDRAIGRYTPFAAPGSAQDTAGDGPSAVAPGAPPREAVPARLRAPRPAPKPSRKR